MRSVVTQKANKKRECVLVCFFPCSHPRKCCAEVMCMNASIMHYHHCLIPLKVLTLAQFTSFADNLDHQLGWRLLSNFMSWLHLHSFSGVVQQPHPKNRQPFIICQVCFSLWFEDRQTNQIGRVMSAPFLRQSLQSLPLSTSTLLITPHENALRLTIFIYVL